MGIHFIFLWTDILLYGVFILSLLLLLRGLQKYHIRQAWRQVFKRPLAIIASMVLLMYVVIGLLDSIHFEASTIVNGKTVASQRSMSVFDAILSPLGQVYEKTYSSPFALRQFVLALGATVCLEGTFSRCGCAFFALESIASVLRA